MNTLPNEADSLDLMTLPEEEPRTIPVSTRYILEDFKPCSQSHLWKLMMSFYGRKGPDSWSQGIVPSFITSNCFIGKSYAKVLMGYLRDCCGANSSTPMNKTEKFYIIELGSGSGKFAFNFLKSLDEMKEFCDFPFDQIVYVMTDFTETNLNFWNQHPGLKPYFDSGHLDAAIFDAVGDSEITLVHSGKVLRASSCVNPIAIIANYLFDTLYHDIFQVDKGELKEGLVSVGSKESEESDPLNPEIIGRLDNLYKYVPIDPRGYYKSEEGDESHLGNILNWYQDCYKNEPEGASLLFPIGALRALRRLCRLSDNRVVAISGDKGHNSPDQFVGLSDPHIAVHGSFSLMVNYHAIGAWFTSKGGFALHNLQEEGSLKVSCFVLSGGPTSAFTRSTVADDKESSEVSASLTDSAVWLGDAFDRMDILRAMRFPSLRQAFQDSVASFGPNEFFVMQKSLEDDMEDIPLRTVIALLKLSQWDADIFFKFRTAILNQSATCNTKMLKDLCRGMPQIWSNFYFLESDKDIAFEIGRFYYGIKDYVNALKFYDLSIQYAGDHHITRHNQGLCHYNLGDKKTALVAFRQAAAIDPTYEKARSWIDKINREKRGPLPPPPSPKGGGVDGSVASEGVNTQGPDSHSSSRSSNDSSPQPVPQTTDAVVESHDTAAGTSVDASSPVSASQTLPTAVPDNSNGYNDDDGDVEIPKVNDLTLGSEVPMLATAMGSS